jgi:hypothetical protein
MEFKFLYKPTTCVVGLGIKKVALIPPTTNVVQIYYACS